MNKTILDLKREVDTINKNSKWGNTGDRNPRKEIWNHRFEHQQQNTRNGRENLRRRRFHRGHGHNNQRKCKMQKEPNSKYPGNPGHNEKTKPKEIGIEESEDSQLKIEYARYNWQNSWNSRRTKTKVWTHRPFLELGTKHTWKELWRQSLELRWKEGPSRDCPTQRSIPCTTTKPRHYCLCQKGFADRTLIQLSLMRHLSLLRLVTCSAGSLSSSCL